MLLQLHFLPFMSALVFVLIEQQEVFQTVRVPIHIPVIAFGFLSFFVSTAVALWCNYFYGFVFSSTWIMHYNAPV